MDENAKYLADLTREAERLLARRAGLAALRTSSCPQIDRCISFFSDPQAGWTPAEVRHFRSCPYCFEVGLALSRASSRIQRPAVVRTPIRRRIASRVRRVFVPTHKQQ